MLRELSGIMARRIVLAVPMLLVVSVMVFVVLRAIPADPVAMMVPPTATAADIAEIRSSMGLDRPIVEQYGIWLGQVVQGDFGRSTTYRRDVVRLIADTLPATVELAVLALVCACLLGIVGGLVMFAFRGTRLEAALDVVGMLSMSVPQFLWAIFLILGLGVAFDLLPFTGRLGPEFTQPDRTGMLLVDALLVGDAAMLGSALEHLVMPVLALAFGFAPLIMRIMQSSLTDAYQEDYIVTARLRGLSERRVLVRHALRNAFLPTLSLIGVQFGFLFGGTLLVEVIFSFHGIGSLMIDAIRNVDLPVIQAIALIYASATLLANLGVDMGYLLLDPRLRAA